jgi:diadenylate cyclase
MTGISAALIKELFTWRAAIDVVLMALMLFFASRTLRRLGTWKIVAGILIAMAVFMVANVADLRGIGWFYANVSQVAVLALIVIFQPEIRKVFERAASLRRSEVGGRRSDLASMIVDAVFAMAGKNRGAIVVLPGKEPIKEWLSGGSPLNADPSVSLIESIFDPHSPGHDGAMVVENGRLALFGVRLPLSKSEALSEKLGTRHHAGQGLSEVSDALVLVVSEERGKVTLFRDGTSKEMKEKTGLATEIASHWEQTASYRLPMEKGKRRWPHVFEFSVSLGVAIVFWSTVIATQGELRERGFFVPVEFVTPRHLSLVGEKPTTVKLHLTGPKAELDTINPSQLSIRIDLSEAMPGEQTLVVAEEDVKLPKRVRLLDTEPSDFVVSLVEIVEKEVMVKPQLVGKLRPDLKIKSLDVNPQAVKVLAPVSMNKENQVTLTTTPIYLESIEESTRVFCKIIAPPSVHPVERRWPDVEVSIEVSPKP